MLAANSRQNFSSYIDRIVYFVAPPTGESYSAPIPTTNCVVYYPSSSRPTPATLKPGRYARGGFVRWRQF